MSFSVVIINQTANARAYLNGTILLPASGSVSIVPGNAPYLIYDQNFLSDVNTATVTISDGVNVYSGEQIISYLVQNFVIGNAPQNSNDPVAYTLAGLGFSIAANPSLSNTTETPLTLLVNPSGSGVNARVLFLMNGIDSTQGIITTRVYSSPTVSATGTNVSAAIQNSFLGGPNNASSIMTISSGPTVSANGTLRSALVTSALVNSSLHDFKQTIILAPGTSILITGQAANLGLLSSVTSHMVLHWVEA